MGDQQGERLRRQKNKGLLSMATEVFLAMTENIVRSPQGAAEGGEGQEKWCGAPGSWYPAGTPHKRCHMAK